MYPIEYVQRFLKRTGVGMMGHLCLIIVTSSMLPDHAKFIQYGCELQHLFFLPLSLLFPSSFLSLFFLHRIQFPTIILYNFTAYYLGALPLHRILLVLSTQQLDRVYMPIAQSRPTLYDPVHCSPPGSSVHGIILVRILEWVSMPSSRYTEYRTQNTIRLLSHFSRVRLRATP